MTASGGQTVLQRKAQVARRAQATRALTPARALRLALERCAAREFGFALTVTAVEITTDVAEGIAADLPDQALVVLLDGPGGVPGAAIVDVQMVAALVEAQTMGRVSARPAEPRAPTRTDAAMSAPLIEGVLSRLADLVEGGAEWGAGVRFGAMVQGAQALALALGTGPYRVMRVGCLMGTERGAELLLALPLPPPDPQSEPHTAETAPGDVALRTRLMGAPVRLDAVLARIPVQLSRLRSLAPGDLLALPQGALGSARLESVGGRVVSQAILGQVNGQRAMRLRGLATAGDGRETVVLLGRDVAAQANQAATASGGREVAEPRDDPSARAPSQGYAAAPVAAAEDLPDLSDLGLSFDSPHFD